MESLLDNSIVLPQKTPSESVEEASVQEAEAEREIITPKILNVDYRYVKLLGEGASGFTWLAKDRRTALDVAIKELKFVDDFKSLELFEREAEVLQSVDVRGVPKCYKNITDGFTSYIVQQYIPHPSLEKMLEDGEIFDEEEVFLILDKVSEILFALQTQYIPAIIHRDIKPGNILYQRPKNPDDEARVWLIDFGAVDNAHKQSSGSTIAGTFGYMAPEQLQGEVSPRSDFYALGATALHLLTGVFPYEIPNELFQLKFHPVIREHAPKTTKPMIDLLDKLLASNAEHRPQDAHALRKLIHEASESAKKYRDIMTQTDDFDEYPDWDPSTRLGRWFRKTHFGDKLHQKRLAKKREQWRAKQKKLRERLLRELEERERKIKQKQEEEERRLAEARANAGIQIECTARRVSVTRVVQNGRVVDSSLLEGIFCYNDNWFPAYIAPSQSSITFKCTTEAAPNAKIPENTFLALFLPNQNDITIVKQQTVWLTPDFYTKLLGRKAPK